MFFAQNMKLSTLDVAVAVVLVFDSFDLFYLLLLLLLGFAFL